MSYLAHELVGLNLNYHSQDFHVHDQEIHPNSPAASGIELAINNSSSSLKRRLPIPLTATVIPSKGEDSNDDDNYQEPIAKRISLHENKDPGREELRRMRRQEREDIHYALSGFSKILLPDVSTTSTPLYPPPKSGLRRTVSDGQTVANGYFFNQESCGYNQGARDFPRAVSQENFTFGTSNGAAPSLTKAEGVSSGFVHSSSSLPPLPPPLRRTLSEPTSSPNELFPKSTVDGEGSAMEQSPKTKRLEKMKLRLREMGEWWAQVLREADGVEEEEDRQDGPNQQCNDKHDAMAKAIQEHGGTTEEEDDVTTETEIEKETTQEAVSVEMLGECLSINFSCPCNKGYQILLAGKNCYYKLV